VLVGTVTTNGGLIAVVEKSGKIKILSLARGSSGGLGCESEVDEECREGLCSQERASPTSLRFYESDRGLFIFAIDTNGRLIKHRWTSSPVKSVLADVPGPPVELEGFLSIPELPTPARWELAG